MSYKNKSIIASANRSNGDNGVLLTDLCKLLTVISDNKAKMSTSTITKKLPKTGFKESTGSRGKFGATYIDYASALCTAGDKEFMHYVVRLQLEGVNPENITIAHLCKELDVERTNNDLDDMLAIKIAAKDKGIW